MEIKFPNPEKDIQIASAIKCIVEALFEQTMNMLRINFHKQLHSDLTPKRAINGLTKVISRIGSVMEPRWEKHMWTKYDEIIEAATSDLKKHKQEVSKVNKQVDEALDEITREDWIEIKADMLDKENKEWLN